MADPHFQAAPLVSLRGVSLRIRDRHILEGTTWELRLGEHWAVVGPNGSGKSTLVRALAGEIPVVEGEVYPAEPALLRRQQRSFRSSATERWSPEKNAAMPSATSAGM